MLHPDVVRRLGAVLLLAALALAGCSTDYNEKQDGESDLGLLFAAMGDPYPVRELMFISCGYYRIKGEERSFPRSEIHAHMLQPDDVNGALRLRNWESVECGGKPVVDVP